MRFVKRAQQLGFSLEEIETLLDLATGGPASCATAMALAAEKISALDEPIAALAAMRESLRRLVTTCERPPRHLRSVLHHVSFREPPFLRLIVRPRHLRRR